ncbi:hypothetical protein FOZ60_002479 [Perkinsus olseni]|uniref:Uncharacterized protein n=1 Tax=Perkinsus olseni TaxID=32597 RepID=A0A7J6NYS4_PEROL|nr:hypothetical protein FOZ60_002479 [Perkinsus olseni]
MEATWVGIKKNKLMIRAVTRDGQNYIRSGMDRDVVGRFQKGDRREEKNGGSRHQPTVYSSVTQQHHQRRPHIALNVAGHRRNSPKDY